MHAYEDQIGKTIQDEIPAATVIERSDNATVAQHLPLKDGSLICPKIVDQNYQRKGRLPGKL